MLFDVKGDEMIQSYRNRRDKPLLHNLMAGGNLMDKRKDLLSYPLRKAGPHLLKALDKRSDSSVATQLSAMALLAYTASPVFMGNILFPAKLIMMGLRPAPVFEGISFVRNSPYVKPMFNYFHGASPAYKAGARVGGKAGGRVGARLIPGVGYGLLAYDAYDIVVNRSLWGFDLD